MITKIQAAKPYTPNFKGNAYPKYADIGNGYAEITLKFNPESSYGDSLEFAEALYKDFHRQDGGEYDFPEGEPQRIFTKIDEQTGELGCLFDSQKSEINILAFSNEDNISNVISTDNSHLPEEKGVSTQNCDIGFNLNKTERKYENSMGVIKKILTNFFVNEDKIVPKNHPNKDEIAPAALFILEKISKIL